mmetsp:Transcript_22104/g.71346  ORF Transcript_22104/g.71346 Transcript_22104/m.71346 type:complete len:453 (+) Transcript_22104:1156-2514(+)
MCWVASGGAAASNEAQFETARRSAPSCSAAATGASAPAVAGLFSVPVDEGLMMSPSGAESTPAAPAAGGGIGGSTAEASRVATVAEAMVASQANSPAGGASGEESSAVAVGRRFSSAEAPRVSGGSRECSRRSCSIEGIGGRFVRMGMCSMSDAGCTWCTTSCSDSGDRSSALSTDAQEDEGKQEGGSTAPPYPSRLPPLDACMLADPSPSRGLSAEAPRPPSSGAASCCSRMDCSRDQRFRMAWSVRPGSRRAISNHLCPSSATPCTMMSSSARVQELRSFRKLPPPPAAEPPLDPEALGGLAVIPPAGTILAVGWVEPDTPPLPGMLMRGDSGLREPPLPAGSAPRGGASVRQAAIPRPLGWPSAPAPELTPPELSPAPFKPRLLEFPSRALARPLMVSWRRLHRLRTASSERPGSWAAMTRQRHPSCSTPFLMSSSSCGDHSLRGKAAA